MSWLKNLLKIFSSNENEEYEDYVNPVLNHQEKINGQIETKITYQYPKGNFRFPIIPDRENSVVHKEKSEFIKKEEDKKKVFKKTEERKVNTPVEKPIQHTHYERIQPKNKQPFRPTDIPSPVYGFQKPPKKNKPSNDHKVSKETHLHDNNDLLNDHHHSVNEQLESIKMVVEPPSNYKEVKPSELLHSDISSGSVQIELNEKLQPEAVTHLLEEVEEASQNPDCIQEEHDKANEFGIEEDRVQKNEYEFEEEIVQSNQFDFEKESIQPNESEIEEEQFQTNDVELEGEPIYSNETVFEEEQGQQLNDWDIEEEQGASIEDTDDSINEPPVRSHIPFNVIMLKKDREKLFNKEAISQAEMQKADNEAAVTVNSQEEYIEEDYVFPSRSLLNPPEVREMDKQWVVKQSELLDETLVSFNVRAKVVNVSQGPSVTRFEVQPEPGVKVNKITNLSDDIKLSLAAKDIRIEAPIPGKHTIGIELPNAQSRPVYINEIISSEIFQKSESPLTAALGLDISGKPVITDLRKMPHGLIAGATGSGKSVCINSILVSLLYKATPDELKLLMIDPKMVELAPYNHIPHLVSPVITDVKAATAALKWAVDEMERRYELFAHTGVREIQRYNELAEQNRQFNQKLPFIVIVIDELADLMMMAPADVEEAICRIAQKARACGIHLIIATQRPSVDVITGLIKANVPTRIAFSVSSQVDSRTIIDISGAEKLLGRGDMLFLENGSSKPVRLQGTYVSDEEIDKVVEHVRYERKPNYLFEQEELLKKAVIQDEEDEIFHDVCEFVMEQGAASTSLIQRNFRIGYNRAARLMEMMEQQGIISEARGGKPRDILISREEYEILQSTAETNL